MKTDREAKAINRFCDDLSDALTATGNFTRLKYMNESEYVEGDVNGYDVQINVRCDDVEAAARDIIRSINRVFGGKTND